MPEEEKTCLAGLDLEHMHTSELMSLKYALSNASDTMKQPTWLEQDITRIKRIIAKAEDIMEKELEKKK